MDDLGVKFGEILHDGVSKHRVYIELVNKYEGKLVLVDFVVY